MIQGVYFIKGDKAVSEFVEGVETDRLLVIGKYCKFYLSMENLGRANFSDAQKKAASVGEKWECPDSFQGRTIGLMSSEIRDKAEQIGARFLRDVWWFWTNEEHAYDRTGAWGVGMATVTCSTTASAIRAMCSLSPLFNLNLRTSARAV